MRCNGRVWIVACLLLTVALAGCAQPDNAPGEDGGPGGSDPSTPAVEWREHEHLGTILTDMEGYALYVFTRDGPANSTCTAGCAEAWPPVTVPGQPTGPGGVGERLDTITRPDGGRQVTIDDRPLYRYAGDDDPGEVNGQGRAGAWYVVRQSEQPGQRTVDLLDGPGEHAVESGPVGYFENATGHLAKPSTGEGYPGVVMIPEWWGLNDNIRRMADALASHGYVVLAVDPFQADPVTTSEAAREQVQALDQDEANRNMRAAVELLRTQEGATRIASLGWCFGGGQSLQLALTGETLDATVLYYGTPLVTNETRLDVIGWPVQGIFGDQDGAIPVDQVDAFERALVNLSIEHEVHVYEGVGHAFANPSGDAYAPSEAMDAWDETLAFLDEHLAQR